MHQPSPAPSTFKDSILGQVLGAGLILNANQPRIGLLFVAILVGSSALVENPLICFGLLGLSLISLGIWLSAQIISRFTCRAKSILNASLEDFPTLSTTGLKTLDDLIGEAGTIQSQLINEIDCLQEAKIDSDERFQILTNNLAAAVMIRDLSGKILYCSPYSEVLTGYSQDEIRAAQVDFIVSIINPLDRELYFRAQKVSECGEPFQFRYRLIHKTGLEMWVETRAVPIIGDNDEVISTLSVTFDVTSTVRYQRQVEEKNRDLQDFTSMVSHDLKAPIATIKGMLGLIDEDFSAKLDPEVIDNFSHITRATNRLEQLVSGVLEYAKISSQQLASEPVALETVIKEVVSDFTNQIESARANIKLDSNLPIVMGDRLHFYQIFANLIGNALKYRDPNRNLDLQINCILPGLGRTAHLTISDNGLGIPKSKQGLLFRPFQRAHGDNIEGTGIGLASVKRLLEKMGGEIELESEEGKGTKFSLVFPGVIGAAKSNKTVI